MTEALKASFASWEKEQQKLNIVKDPRQWTETQVAHWLCWAIREFSLEGIPIQQFYMKGKDICAMGKENFLARAPPFTGDILWEHLEILQKEVERDRDKTTIANSAVPGNLYEPVCVPDLNELLGSYHSSEEKSHRTPSAATHQTSHQPQQYHMSDGESDFFYIFFLLPILRGSSPVSVGIAKVMVLSAKMVSGHHVQTILFPIYFMVIFFIFFSPLRN
ncbi:UNVERIFIED_CONTAM: hypothetical protein PYX00_007421 [Menopon gallinae]|uniref:PNT domain-containing protein n=1 Tax=Menopon gallinae TaxID=328185 RepID=A0AAW2HJ17_9NEOP